MGTMLTRPPGHRRDIALRPAATAMVFIAEGQPHEMIAVPGVALGDGEVLVAVELSTICDSDVHAYEGRRPAPIPLILGHESVGRVIALGDSGATATDGLAVRIGDRVVWSTSASCDTCELCLRGVPQKCRSLSKYGHDRIGTNGELTGAFGSHMHLRQGTTIVRVPETLPASVLAPASCATATAWAAVARAIRHRDLEGTRVRIYGADLTGLSAAAIAAERGAHVEVRDPDPERRARARRWLAAAAGTGPAAVGNSAGRIDGAGWHAPGSDAAGSDAAGSDAAGSDAAGSDAAAHRDRASSATGASGASGASHASHASHASRASRSDPANGEPVAPDVVIEASGAFVAEALDAVATGGIVVLAGSAFPADRVPVDVESLTRRLVTVAGVEGSTGAELAEAVAFLAGRGRAYPFADAVGAVRPLAAIDEALAEASASGAPLRIGIAPVR